MDTKKQLLFNLLSALSQKEAFFLIWAAMVCGFILMMISFYRGTKRRNFREPGEAGKKVVFDPRLPPAGTEREPMSSSAKK